MGGRMRRVRPDAARALMAGGAVAPARGGAGRRSARPASARARARPPIRAAAFRRPRGGRAAARRVRGAGVEVAGLVVARQRPETAKGFVFVLIEDIAGMVNVIVRPDVYVEHRTAIRGEPLLWVRGKLAKDDGTVNVIAEEAKGLQINCG